MQQEKIKFTLARKLIDGKIIRCDREPHVTCRQSLQSDGIYEGHFSDGIDKIFSNFTNRCLFFFLVPQIGEK